MSWELTAFLLLALAVGAGFGWYEREHPPARVLALVAALAALAVVGRLAFAAFPNVKPTTDIVLFAGYALGAAPGFAVGAVTAVASNVFMGQGPWTVWQMAGWGGVGVGGALLAKLAQGRELGRLPLAIACGLAGLAFGAWMDVYQWTLAAQQDLGSYVAVSASSLPYNIAHAAGNVVFCLVIGPAFVRALRRYRRRFEVRWQPVVAASLAVLTLAAGAASAPEPAEAATAAGKAARYLKRAQNPDGGFGALPRGRSAQLYTGWAALGLASARRNPADVRRRGGRSVVSFLRRRHRGLRDVGELERTIMVLRAAGVSPYRFRGRDLVAELKRKRRRSGSFSGYVSYTAFGLLALKAARQRLPRSSIRWLLRSQNDDGGFGVGRGAASDADMTGAVLQALRAAGRSRSAAATRGVRFLRRLQRGDGGFPMSEGQSSNAQSTAYAVQGLVAVRAAPGSVSRALRYLKRLQRPNGSVRYSSVSSQTPVWVTAQALMALRRKPLPLGRVPRAKRSRSSPAAATAASGSRTERGSATRDASGGGAAALSDQQRADRAAAAALRQVDVPDDAPTRRAAARPERGGSDDAGLSPWLAATAVAATLALLWGLRLALRRPRPAAS